MSSQHSSIQENAGQNEHLKSLTIAYFDEEIPKPSYLGVILLNLYFGFLFVAQ
jgi:hypothetical protein